MIASARGSSKINRAHEKTDGLYEHSQAAACVDRKRRRFATYNDTRKLRANRAVVGTYARVVDTPHTVRAICPNGWQTCTDVPFGREVGRVGSNEFLVLMPGSEAEGGHQLGRRIALAVRSLVIPFNRNNVSPLRVSIGIAAYPKDGKDQDSLRKKARAAAERAAKRGGNCIVHSNDLER